MESQPQNPEFGINSKLSPMQDLFNLGLYVHVHMAIVFPMGGSRGWGAGGPDTPLEIHK